MFKYNTIAMQCIRSPGLIRTSCRFAPLNVFLYNPAIPLLGLYTISGLRRQVSYSDLVITLSTSCRVSMAPSVDGFRTNERRGTGETSVASIPLSLPCGHVLIRR